MKHNVIILFEWTKDGNFQDIKNYFFNKYDPIELLDDCPMELMYRDQLGRVILHWACLFGQLAIVKWIVDSFAVDLELVDNQGYTPLDCAVIRGYNDVYDNDKQFRIVEKMLKKGSKFKESYKNINNPLHWSFYYGNSQLIFKLIDIKYEYLEQKNQDGFYPIDYLFLQEKDQEYRKQNDQIFSQIIEFYQKDQKVLEANQKSQHTRYFINSKVLFIILFKQIILIQFFQYRSKWSVISEPKINRVRKTKLKQSLNFKIPKPSQNIIIYNPLQEEDILCKNMEEREQDNDLQKISNYDTYLVKNSSRQKKVQINHLPEKPKKQKQYQIYYQITNRQPDKQFELRMMYWSAYINYYEAFLYFLNRKCSPFQKDFQGTNALQIACIQGNFNIVQLIVQSDYQYIEDSDGKKRIFQKLEAISMETTILPSTGLHLAIENNHYNIAELLIMEGASILKVNYRNLKPLELKSNAENQKLKLLVYKQSNNLSLKEQGFCYVIKTKGHQRVSDDIIRLQLINLNNNLSQQQIQFEFITLMGSDDKSNFFNQVKPQYFYHIIRLCNDAVYQLAQLHEIRMYHLDKRILCQFQYQEKQKYEFPKDVLLQDLIARSFDSEFNMDVFQMEGLVLDHFPIDDPLATRDIQEFWKQHTYKTIKNCLYPVADQVAVQSLSAIAFYYGPEVGWYFAFMTHLISWLSIPSFVGVALGLYEIVSGDYNSNLIPIYACLLAIWSTFFMESWKRRQNELSFIWDMSDYEKNEPIRAKYSGQFQISPVNGQIREFDRFTTFQRKFIAEAPTICFGLAMAISSFIIFQSISQLNEIKNNNFLSILVASMNGVIMTILSELYKAICSKVVEWENHMHKSDEQFSYIMKLFIFEFVNSYITLIYQAIYQKSSKMQISVAGIIITRGLIQNQTNIIPYLLNLAIMRQFKQQFYWFKNQVISQQINQRQDHLGKNQTTKSNLKKKNSSFQNLSPQASIAFNSENNHDDIPFHIGIDYKKNSEDQTIISDQEYMKQKLNLNQQIYLLEQVEMSAIKQQQKELIDEYTGLAIQFGYITMFATSFTCAPIFFMINLYLNLKFSIYNYQNVMRRQQSKAAPNIGIWQNIFNYMNYSATIMNCLLVATVNNSQLNNLIGSSNGNFQNSIIILVAAEHLMILIKFLIAEYIDDIPQWIKLEVARREYISKK